MKDKRLTQYVRFNYYTVWKGRKTGVFNKWEDCLNSIDRYPDNEFLGFDSFEEATRAFQFGSLKAYRKVLEEEEIKPGDLW